MLTVFNFTFPSWKECSFVFLDTAARVVKVLAATDFYILFWGTFQKLDNWEKYCVESQAEGNGTQRETTWSYQRVKTSQVTYVTMVPRVGNETLRPLGVATGNALSVTRSEDTYEKTPPVGRRQPMTSLPAYHNISAAGRIHHQLLRLKLASEAWLKAQGTQCLVPHSGNHGYIRNLRRSPSWELELRPLGVATGNVIPTSPCWGECKPISQKRRALSQLYPA